MAVRMVYQVYVGGAYTKHETIDLAFEYIRLKMSEGFSEVILTTVRDE